MKEKQNVTMRQRTFASVSLELVSPRSKKKKEFGFIDINNSSRTALANKVNLSFLQEENLFHL